MPKFYLNIAVDTPLYRIFDYLPAEQSSRSDYQTGQRVLVSFGKTQKIGVIVGIASSTVLKQKQLKPINQLLDSSPLLSAQDLKLFQWAADYYHHPIGEVFSQALPKQIRSGLSPSIKLRQLYSLSDTGLTLEQKQLKRSPRQSTLWHHLKVIGQPVDIDSSSSFDWDWRGPLKSMIEKNWVTISPEDVSTTTSTQKPGFQPNPAQQAAIDTVSEASKGFHVFLLDGVTGSGKTEVYLQLIQRVIDAGKQVLILLPEITLTPQLAHRFKQRLAAQMVTSHSGLNDTQRSQAWLRFKAGFANILLGTRSAVFTPMHKPGMIILDEEHDTSFKQQEGFRYSARDIAIMRARDYNIPILLGTATPSLESLYNVQQNRFTHLVLPERTAGALKPDIRLIDCRNQTLNNHYKNSRTRRTSYFIC